MTARKNRPPSQADISAAKSRLKDMGAGLGTLFESVSKLLDEASANPQSVSQGRRFKTHMDVRIGSLDDVIAAKQTAQRPAPKPHSAPAEPIAVEHHKTAEALMVIVTLGDARPTDVTMLPEAASLRVTCGSWSKPIKTDDDYDVNQAERIIRPGYLTFMVPRRTDTPSKQ